MEAFVVNGLAYDIIDANKKQVQVHWPDFGYVENAEIEYEVMRNILEGRPTGVLSIPENVVNPKDGISYTVVAIDGKWTAEYTSFEGNCKETETYEGLSTARITEVHLPKTIRKLGWNAFSGTNLTKIDLPNGVKEISFLCYSGCLELQEIEIPSSVKIIKQSAFQGCRSLKNVEIPSSVDLIEESAFLYCRNLKEVIIYSNKGDITIEKGAFPSETKITYKSGLLSKLWGKLLWLKRFRKN